jgi:dimethylamine/trimethylamine dehydrogenase
VALYDDDHYYLGGVLAELLVTEGWSVTLVTPAPDVSTWTHNTMEQHRIQGRLLDVGVEIITAHELDRTDPAGLVVRSVYTGESREINCETAVLVTSRLPNDALYLELAERGAPGRLVGDALSPGTIASAVWDGRRFAEELDARRRDEPFPRNIAAV